MKEAVFLEEQENLYKYNLNLLKQNYEYLYKKLIKINIDSNYNLKGKNAYPNLLYKEDKYYQMPFMDTLRPQFKEVNLQKGRMLLFLGFGLGYNYQYFNANLRNEDWLMHLIIVEKSLTAFYYAMHLYKMDNLILDKKVLLLVGLEEDDLYSEFKKVLNEKRRFYSMKAFDTFCEDGAYRIFDKYYKNCINKFKEAGEDIISSYGNSPDDSLVGVENMFLNKKIIANSPGIINLKDKFKNKPAVVVATGPSLNKNKELLRKIKDRAIIVSVDASLKILMDMGVKPNIITSLERVEEVVPLIDGFSKEELKEIYLAATPVVKPTVYNAYDGPKLMVYRNFAHFDWLENDKGTIPIKQSAGNMAFSVAAYMGCSPIILIGQDLAYAEDFKTHAEGMVYGEEDENHINEEKFLVKGNIKEEVYTNKWWYMFLKGYEADLREFGGICVNATEGGAFIRGTKVMTFNEAIEEYLDKKIDIDKVFRKNAVVEKKIANKYLKKWEKKERKLLKSLKEMKKLLNDEFNKSTELVKKYENMDRLELNNNINALRNNVIYFEKQRKSFANIDNEVFNKIVMHVIQSYWIMYEMSFIGAFNDSNEEVDGLLNLINKYNKFFMVHKNMLEEIYDRIKKSIEESKEA